MRAAGSFGKGYAVYLLITVGYAVLASVAVVAVGRGGLADGGGISELKCASAAAKCTLCHCRGPRARDQPLEQITKYMDCCTLVNECTSFLV